MTTISDHARINTNLYRLRANVRHMIQFPDNVHEYIRKIEFVMRHNFEDVIKIAEKDKDLIIKIALMFVKMDCRDIYIKKLADHLDWPELEVIRKYL